MSATSSARDPVGSSPQRSESFFNCLAFAAARTVNHHQSTFGGFDKDFDTLVENLSFLHQINFLLREMIALLGSRGVGKKR